MKVYLPGGEFAYEIENIVRLFFSDVEMLPGKKPPSEREKSWCTVRISSGSGALRLVIWCEHRGMRAGYNRKFPADLPKKELERIIAITLFGIFSDLVGTRPEWGVLTGVRPAKFVRMMLEENPDVFEAVRTLREQYSVSRAKAELAAETAAFSLRCAALNKPESYSLYISIPFCPSRCSYCSFVSKSIERERHLVEPYLEKLIEELRITAEIFRDLQLRIESVYIGGGTPAVLEAEQLDRLCCAVNRYFLLATSREFTVEAGRPDVITPQKLEAIARAGVNRISINPQSGNDEVLRAIGRKHTAADVERCFEDARRVGFESINADLIAGLERDTPESFSETLDWIHSLAPENITVHALTVKRASRLRETGIGRVDAGWMVRKAASCMADWGYRPYYMYKQKGTVENLENTGYSLPGKECLYNVFIMDELHTIASCGAGAVTKLRRPGSSKIERIFNYKYPAEYIAGFDELVRRKERIRDFYQNV